MLPKSQLLKLSCIAAAVVLSVACNKASAPAAGAGAKKGGGEVPVTIAKVTQKDVPVEIQIIGNVEAYATITIKAQAGGELMKVHFQEGDYVRKGDVLFTIDPRPLQAQLSQVEANLARDLALEAQAEANLAKNIAQEQYVRGQSGRYDRLFQQGIVSKDQSEQLRTNADALASGVNADRAAIQSAKAATVAGRAAVDNVRLQLAYTTIRAPLDGRTGNLNVKQGNIVSANSTDLIAINQVQPIYVTFSVPEAQLAPVRNYMNSGKLQVVATPQEEGATPQTGILTFVDNAVDVSTGTIKMKGTFPNSDRKLWPGQFVRVVLRLTMQRNALVVPNQAVQTSQDGAYVYVVKENQTVESRPVVTGSRLDQELVIDKGLEAGESVVTEGHLRLAPGMRVQQRDARGGKKGGKGPGEERKDAGPGVQKKGAD